MKRRSFLSWGAAGPGRPVGRGRREPGGGGPVPDAQRVLRAAADLQDRQPGGFLLRPAHVSGGRKDLRLSRPGKGLRGGQRRLHPPGLHGRVFPERRALSLSRATAASSPPMARCSTAPRRRPLEWFEVTLARDGQLRVDKDQRGARKLPADGVTMNPIRDVWQSIVRRDPLSTDKGKSELVFLNVWLHIHPAKVKKENLKVKHTFYLGFITFFLFLILVTTGRGADVLLPALSAAGLPGHEGPPVRGLPGKLSAQHAPLGGPRHGDLRLPAHVPRLLHRLLQAAATVQLGDRRRPVPADAGTLVHRLSAAVGPAGLLGHHGRDQHRQLRSAGGRAAFASCCWAATPSAKSALLRFYVLHVAVLPAAGDAVDHGALLAGPQGRRAVAAGLEVEGARNPRSWSPSERRDTSRCR